MYNKMVIGIDQSYTRTGISIACDNKLMLVKSIPFKGLRTKPDKRKLLANVLTHILNTNVNKAIQTLIIVERIRMFSGGKHGFIAMNYIKSTAGLITTIVDVAHTYNIQVYSADTRAWKSKIVGTTKKIKGDPKLATIKHLHKLGWGKAITSINRNGKTVYDDDAADSACIALYGFHPQAKLKLEQ